jgi:hypothetical protein
MKVRLVFDVCARLVEINAGDCGTQFNRDPEPYRFVDQDLVVVCSMYVEIGAPVSLFRVWKNILS